MRWYSGCVCLLRRGVVEFAALWLALESSSSALVLAPVLDVDELVFVCRGAGVGDDDGET